MSTFTENVATLRIHKLSVEQYQEALARGEIEDNALYLTPDFSDSTIDPQDLLNRIEALESNTVDLSTNQRANGIKTFTSGFAVGEEGSEFNIVYDDEKRALRFIFPDA